MKPFGCGHFLFYFIFISTNCEFSMKTFSCQFKQLKLQNNLILIEFSEFFISNGNEFHPGVFIWFFSSPYLMFRIFLFASFLFSRIPRYNPDSGFIMTTTWKYSFFLQKKREQSTKFELEFWVEVFEEQVRIVRLVLSFGGSFQTTQI